MPSPSRNNYPNSPTYRAAKENWNIKGKSLAVKSPRNLAQVQSSNSSKKGNFALPYYGYNAPPRSGNSPVLLSPSVSVRVNNTSNNRNWNKTISNETKIPSRKSRIQHYAKIWLNINLPHIVAVKGWKEWIKILHPNKHGKESANREARRNALIKETIKGYTKNKKLVRRI